MTDKERLNKIAAAFLIESQSDYEAIRMEASSKIPKKFLEKRHGIKPKS